MSSFSVHPKPVSNYRPKKTAFHIDAVEVRLSLDLALASALGDFILDHRPENPAIAALCISCLTFTTITSQGIKNS